MDTRVLESMDHRTEKGTKCPESMRPHSTNQLVRMRSPVQIWVAAPVKPVVPQGMAGFLFSFWPGVKSGFSVHLAPNSTKRYNAIRDETAGEALFSGRFFVAVLRRVFLRLCTGHHVIEAVEGLHSLRLGGRYDVGVDVGRGGGLGVAQLL